MLLKAYISRYVPTLKTNVFFPLKIVSKRKKQKKKKAYQTKRTSGKPKGNGISPEGWQGKKINSAKHLICLAIMP